MTYIIIILALILLNGLFALSEISIISARKSRLEADEKRGSKAARTALKLAADPDIFLSTIQIGITLIGILTGLYSGDKLSGYLSPIFVDWGLSESVASSIASIIIVVIVTYLTLILGELVPKRIGMAVANGAAKLMARPIYWLSVVTKPFVWILAKSTSVLVRLLGVKDSDNHVTEADIRTILHEGTESGEVKKVEQDIVERVFLMGDHKVSSIMTHRSDIISLDNKATPKEIRATLAEDLHDKYPVIDRATNRIHGIVSLKDLILRLDDKDFSLEAVTRPAPALHENMSIYDGLEQLKANGAGCALVFDEFGECQGIITFRDILEGLVGIINDPHEAPDIVARQDGCSWLIDGQCSFYDFLIFTENEDITEDTDYNTISGLILSRLSHIPTVGESVDWHKFTFEVVDMDGARIDKILARLK